MLKYRENRKKDLPISPLLPGISAPIFDTLHISFISIEQNKNEVDWVDIHGAIAISILTDKTFKSFNIISGVDLAATKYLSVACFVLWAE